MRARPCSIPPIRDQWLECEWTETIGPSGAVALGELIGRRMLGDGEPRAGDQSFHRGRSERHQDGFGLVGELGCDRREEFASEIVRELGCQVVREYNFGGPGAPRDEV